MDRHVVAYFIDLDSVHCKKWVRHLSKTNSAIIITYHYMTPYDIELPGVPMYNLFPKTFPVKNFISRWFTIFQIWRVLKKHKVTLLHSMYCYPNSVWANYFKRYKRVITTRGSDVLVDYRSLQNSDNSGLIYLKKKLEEAFKEACFITSTSLQQKEYLISKNVDAKKLTVVRTGIEPEHFSIKSNNHDTEVFRILSPRSIQKNYNIHNMLLALKHIITNLPDIRIRLDQVMFYINPDYLKSIRQLIDELGLRDYVSFIPPYDIGSVSDIYAQYDLAIMIPQSDGTPVSALEVMINKKPLVISRLPYDKDVINEDLCWFVDQNDPKDIADCILKIKNEKSSEIEKKLENAYNNVLKNGNTYIEMKKVLELYKGIEA
jgi:glycosyltransferase involved in cell wall biosynthesis